MLSREATSETYGPGSISIILIFQYLVTSFAFYFAFTFYFASLYQKYQKYYIYQISLS